MISDNNTNLNLSYHPPNPCLLLLPRSLMLPPPPPFPSPSTSIYIQLPHTDTDFFRFYRKAWANKKVFSCNWNWDSVGTFNFLRVAGREFQRDGAKKLKERCPNDNNNALFYVLFLQIGANSPLEHKEPKQSKQTCTCAHTREHTHTHTESTG